MKEPSERTTHIICMSGANPAAACREGILSHSVALAAGISTVGVAAIIDKLRFPLRHAETRRFVSSLQCKRVRYELCLWSAQRLLYSMSRAGPALARESTAAGQTVRPSSQKRS